MITTYDNTLENNWIIITHKKAKQDLHNLQYVEKFTSDTIKEWIKLFRVYLIVQCCSHNAYKRSLEILLVSVAFRSLEEGLTFKFVVQIFH